MFDIGLSELLIILVVALIALGPKRLPEMARALGRGLAEFRRASEDIRRSVFLADEEPEKPGYPDTLHKRPQPSPGKSTPSPPVPSSQAPSSSESPDRDPGAVSPDAVSPDAVSPDAVSPDAAPPAPEKGDGG